MWAVEREIVGRSDDVERVRWALLPEVRTEQTVQRYRSVHCRRREGGPARVVRASANEEDQPEDTSFSLPLLFGPLPLDVFLNFHSVAKAPVRTGTLARSWMSSRSSNRALRDGRSVVKSPIPAA